MVYVPDRSGNPVPGVVVEFAVTGGGGTISGGPVVATDSAGRAALNAWTLGSTGGLNTVTATASGSGIVGNPVTFTATAEIGHWTRIAELPTRRFLLAAASLGDKVYAVGGVDFDPMATVEAYDPAAGAWISRAPMPTARYGLGVGVIDGILYAVGGTGTGNTGRELEAYDPATDTWTTKAPMPTARVGLGVAVVGGILYAIGGQGCPPGSSGPCSQSLGTVEAYDPATDTWTTEASMPTPRQALAVATVNGIVYGFGGMGTDNVEGLTVVEAYDPATDTWSTRAPLTQPTWGLAAAGGEGVLYVAGGYVWDGSSLNATARLGLYDPLTDSWRTGTAMPAPRPYIAAAVLNGLLYVVGPGDSEGTAEVYHP
jgi:N-acetylneuraminic acid mutarotase